MFTPESLPSNSPLHKIDKCYRNNDDIQLQLKDEEKSCLRQLMNDANILFPVIPTGNVLFLNAAKLLQGGFDSRLKCTRLLLQVTINNRASKVLFCKWLEHGRDILTVLLMDATLTKESTQSIKDSNILFLIAFLALEMGGGDLSASSVLLLLCQEDSQLLYKIILHLTDCLLAGSLAECILSLLFEHQLTSKVSIAYLKDQLCKKETLLKQRLSSYMLATPKYKRLSALFVTLCVMAEFPLPLNASQQYVSEVMAELKESLKQPGSFPYTYTYLCLLHVLLGDEQTLTELSTTTSYWWAGDKDFLGGSFLRNLLQLFMQNLNSKTDSYVHHMLASLISKILERKTDDEEKENDIRKAMSICLEELAQLERADPSITVHISLHRNRWKYLMDRNDHLIPKKVLASMAKVAQFEGKCEIGLERHPSSTAFFVPLIYFELSQLIKKTLMTL